MIADDAEAHGQPKPVPWPGGMVVKKGWNTFSITCPECRRHCPDGDAHQRRTGIQMFQRHFDADGAQIFHAHRAPPFANGVPRVLQQVDDHLLQLVLPA